MTDASMSRTGVSGNLGKLDDYLEKMRISGDTKQQLTIQAAQVGMPLCEYIRMLLDCKAWGVEHVANMAAERIRRVGGNV